MGYGDMTRQTDSQNQPTPTLAQLTTIGVGGAADRFVEPQSEEEFIDAVRDADTAGLPLLVIGGGSNLLVADEPFHGVVVRDARRGISVLDDDAHADVDAGTVAVVAQAGVNWDDFVASCIDSGFSGIEGLSGVPGSVGASVVQNIGAYGQEVASCVSSVRVFDRENQRICQLDRDEMHFGYRSSALKSSMYAAPATPAGSYFPTPRYVVLAVTFTLQRSETDEVAFDQLAKALDVEVGEQMPNSDIRQAVLKVRAAKGMLEDPSRYLLPSMRGCKNFHTFADAFSANELASRESSTNASGEAGFPVDFDRHSCGSFFMNPILTKQQAAKLPPEAPQFKASLPSGEAGIKTSAAWLIDHAGFHKGYKVRPDAKAGLSTLHTLALTNRGGAHASDVEELAQTIQNGVEDQFGIRLVPEPVVVGVDLR